MGFNSGFKGLNMLAVTFSKILAHFYHTTRRYIVVITWNATNSLTMTVALVMQGGTKGHSRASASMFFLGTLVL